MARSQYANNAKTTTTGAITSGATTFTCTSLAAFPALSGGQYFYATLLDASNIPEIIKVTATSGNTITTCVRAQDGTSARAFTSGAYFSINVTNAVLTELAPLTGEGVSGSWGINITGNAATATLASVAATANSLAGTLGVAGGGTGSTTSAGARTSLGSGAVGDALFLSATAAVARATLQLGKGYVNAQGSTGLTASGSFSNFSSGGNSDFNSTTGVWTAPYAGTYLLTMGMTGTGDSSVLGVVSGFFKVNGVGLGPLCAAVWWGNAIAGVNQYPTLTVVTQLSAGNQVTVGATFGILSGPSTGPGVPTVYCNYFGASLIGG